MNQTKSQTQNKKKKDIYIEKIINVGILSFSAKKEHSNINLKGCRND